MFIGSYFSKNKIGNDDRHLVFIQPGEKKVSFVSSCATK